MGKKMKKVEYSRLTFILSVIGFIGSLGFYVGVLRQVYNPSNESEKIEQLEIENQQLKESIFQITTKLKEDA